jgi:Flp pilus assembly protein TadG
MNNVCNLRGQARVFLPGFCHFTATRRASAKIPSIGGRLLAFLRSGDEGQNLVEFAVMLPILLLTLTFMFSLCMAIINYEQLVSAASAGGQTLAGARNFNTDPCNAVETAITNFLPSWNSSKFTYSVTIQNSSGSNVVYGPTTGTGFSCTAAYAVLGADNPNTPASLTITYQYTWIPVFMQHMAGNLTVTQPVNVN